MRVFLSGVEWIMQAPEGNRLRWWYPFDDVDSGDYRGMPKAIVVERAPVDEDIITPEPGGGPAAFPISGNVPYNWWDDLGDVDLFDLALVCIHQLATPAQAIRFTYRGPHTRLRLWDSETDTTWLDTVVVDGDNVYFEAAQMDTVIVSSPVARLESLAVLDLFEDRQLDWQTIAVMDVSPTVTASLDDVLPRHGGASSLTAAEWTELTDIASQAVASTPSDIVEGEPTLWELFNMTLALRWELAALFGMGYYDGPHSDVSKLDEVDVGAELGGPEETMVAYRVRVEDEVLGHSNLIVCPPWIAAPIAAPSQPNYVDPQVRFTVNGTFEATVEQVWQQNDPRAIGVVIDEQISASPTIGGTATSGQFEHRSRAETDPPSVGRLARTFDVPFHDVTLTSTASATDAWDRVSQPSPKSAPTTLQLYHQPVPPGLMPGSYDDGSVRIPRQVDESLGTWNPDPIVQAAGGRVVVYRRDHPPRIENGTGQLPSLVSGDRHKTTVDGVSSVADFDSGYLIANGTKYGITNVVGNDVFFDAPGAGDASVALFPPGPLKLQQDDKHLSLWTQIADFPAVGLPDTLVFNDPLPLSPDEADVLSYAVRISYLGKLGPASNTSQVIRIPATPLVPPPFAVDILGVDFYDRSMVKITLTNPVSAGLYTIWWADGAWNASQFEDHAEPGEYGAQKAHEQRYLFDVLTLPIPRNQNRDVTIGLQAENAAGGKSGFIVVPFTIQA